MKILQNTYGVHLGVAGIDQLGYSERLDVDGSCLKTL